MGKFKAAKKKNPDAPPQMKQGVPCLILIGIIIILVALVMMGALRNAG